jgi:hypothetical protein
VIPPTPNKAVYESVSAREFDSRSPSPSVTSANEDIVLGTGKASIRRAGSGDSSRSATITRGPRIAKGPRAPGGSVSSMVQNLNRNSMTGSPGPTSGGVGARAVNRLSGGSPVKRPASIVGRSAAGFQRRTMASDAEDDVVDRK